MPNLLPVVFHDSTLFLVESANEPFVPMRPVVEGMGLDWRSQHRKLQTDRFSSTVVEMTTVAEDGKQRDMTCLPLRKLPGWLMSIQTGKVADPAVRKRVLQYQHECDDVLWEHWSQAHREPGLGPQLIDPPYLAQARKEAMDHLWACYDVIRDGGQKIPRWEGDDETIVAGFIASALQGSRFLAYFDDQMRLNLRAISQTACIIDPEKTGSLEEAIKHRLPPESVAKIAQVCLEKLSHEAKKGIKKH